ncbi:MAG: 3-oxoacyl-ACP synthase [Roseivirga sp.]|nr:3-oxoacyl-ACP synthase [Roseivirga sp.]
MLHLKKALFSACESLVNGRIKSIEDAMRNAQSAANEETKSSAGDKYETGRAMMHLEKEKLAGQLSEAAKMKKALDLIDSDKLHSVAALGSVVRTAKASYYISVSVGKLEVEGEVFFAISPASPIGRQLLDKKQGESFSFAGRNQQIVTLA